MQGRTSPCNIHNSPVKTIILAQECVILQEMKSHAVTSCYYALTVASFKSTGGCVEGEISVSGISVGAVIQGPAISKTKAQQQSSMTCI